VEALLDVDADVDAGPPLVYAAGRGYISIEGMLLNHKAKINASGQNGWTALHAASFNGNAPAMKLLIEYGADITAL
jgi:uncharacterized protein